MKVDAPMAAQPSLDGRAFVRTQIVEDDVNRLGRCGRLFDVREEAHKRLRVPLRSALAQDDAVEHAQRRIQTGRAVPDVVVGLPLRYARPQRQHRPRPVQRSRWYSSRNAAWVLSRSLPRLAPSGRNPTPLWNRRVSQASDPVGSRPRAHLRPAPPELSRHAAVPWPRRCTGPGDRASNRACCGSLSR